MRWSGQVGHLATRRDDDAAGGGHDAADASQPLGDQPTSSQRTLHDRQGSHHADDLGEFSALIGAHAATLTHVAAALVGVSDAEDAAQEAIVRAWRAWPELRDRTAARAWLISITINVCRDWLRGRFGARRRLTESLTGDGDEPRAIAQIDADPGASDHAAALDLRHAITTLDEDLRVIVALRYYSGLDSTTIGAALGLPAATVRTKLRRALGLLREQLSGYVSGPRPATPTNDSEGRR
ncbi:MAG TPA: RNA polymerase sigma factor [Ktedonobacterales bacterium]|nr:RNA polymerase sigma factor [Ktedonobacterales bacterium]